MRAMLIYTYPAQAPQPVLAGMRAMPQGVLGGRAHTHIKETEAC